MPGADSAARRQYFPHYAPLFILVLTLLSDLFLPAADARAAAVRLFQHFYKSMVTLQDTTGCRLFDSVSILPRHYQTYENTVDGDLLLLAVQINRAYDARVGNLYAWLQSDAVRCDFAAADYQQEGRLF